MMKLHIVTRISAPCARNPGTLYGKKYMQGQNKIILQSAARGFLARKKYAINDIPKKPAVDYEAFLVGNDPTMPELSQYTIKENFALIATSCFRAVGIACKLAADSTVIPKIIIIDTSRQVIEMWKNVQQCLQSCATQEEFQSSFPDLLYETTYLYRVINSMFSPHPAIRYPNQDTRRYFQSLITQFGYDRIQSLVLNTVVLQHDWRNKELFTKLKNILDCIGINKIVAYPSNIVTSYMPHKEMDTIQNILGNINILCPSLTIHTDLCPRHFKPEKAYYFTDSHPEFMREQLFPGGERLKCWARQLK
jgi:hypothetical protein